MGLHYRGELIDPAVPAAVLVRLVASERSDEVVDVRGQSRLPLAGCRGDTDAGVGEQGRSQRQDLIDADTGSAQRQRSAQAVQVRAVQVDVGQAAVLEVRAAPVATEKSGVRQRGLVAVHLSEWTVFDEQDLTIRR